MWGGVGGGLGGQVGEGAPLVWLGRASSPPDVPSPDVRHPCPAEGPARNREALRGAGWAPML